MKLNKIIAFPALALTAGLSLAACGSVKAPAAAPAVTHTVTAAPVAAPKPTTPAPSTPVPSPAKTVYVRPAPAKTVIVQAPAAAPAPAAPALANCGDDLYVNGDTSCAFAQNVEADYTGLGPDYASSPVTGLSYTMNCVAGYGNLNGGDSVVCTGGNNALVEWGAN
jgi:hypothetical protein